MSRVYFHEAKNREEVNHACRVLLEELVSSEKLELEESIPLKVHFGEKGNTTFIPANYYDGIIDFLDDLGEKSCFIESNVLYRGERTTTEKHLMLARDHGFTRLPVEIADGRIGEEYVEVEIDKKHFSRCRIARGFQDYNQFIVAAHFKGHVLAGFGGAIKQLGMGFASRAGKLAQHAKSKPLINPLACKKCGVCLEHCPADAISIGLIPRIDRKKCIGCAACIAACPHGVFNVNWASTLPGTFREKLAEYAFAAQKGKKNIYVNFALLISKGCDCESREMDLVAGDLGVFASTDPVAIDLACMDAVDSAEKHKVFGGRDIFGYAESIGLGSTDYELVKL